MNKEEFISKVQNLFQVNSIESYTKAIELINKEIKKNTTEIEITQLELLKLVSNIGITKLKLENANNYKDELHLRGRLIKLYNQAEKKSADSKTKMTFRYESLQELKKQVEVVRKYKHSTDTKISVPKKVGLTVKDIGMSINVFMKEKDVLKKAETVVKGTAISTICSAIILGIASIPAFGIFAVPYTLLSLTNLMPVIAYSGLSSILNVIFSKTTFQQYLYFQSDEYKELINSFMSEHKDQIEELARLLKEKESSKNKEDKISINEKLIEKLDELIASTKIQGLKDSFGLQALGYLRENKELCNMIENEYLDEINNDKERYNFYSKKLLSINYEIFKRGNSIGDAVKNSVKGVGRNMLVVWVAKLILSQLAPATFHYEGLKSLKLPFAFAVMNGLIDIPTYKNKLKFKETKYQGKIAAKNKNRIEEILEMKKAKPLTA